LADSRLLGRYVSGVDPRWDAACVQVLADLTDASTPTMNVVIARIGREVEAEHGHGVVPIPSTATAYRRLKQLAKGTHAFGSGKARRSVAQRPKGVYGRLVATRPGEFVVLDTTPLDVFAMEPVTLRWVPVELTVAMDLFDRCIVGLRLQPVSTKSQDVANVLFQAVTPQSSDLSDSGDDSGDDSGGWPFHGVPRNVLFGTEEPDGVSQQRVGALPGCVPETIVVDHGKQYLSAHVVGVCARMGISVQPAIPHKPTDKPTVERFFRTLRESLLQHLPAYKGPDVYSRGKDVEGQAFLYVSELEQIIREWVGTIYHHTKHSGLCVPQWPGVAFSPAEMFQVGLARAGSLRLPAHPELAYEFLNVAWRTIQHYGVEIDGRRYNGPGLNLHRNHRSTYGGVHAGKWPFCIDVHDVRFIYFKDPDTHGWHRLEWEHAVRLTGPFSADAAEYAKQVSIRTNRHVDPHQAVQDLLEQWTQGEVLTRRDRSLARRLSAQRADANPDETGPAEAGDTGDAGDTARDIASLPSVVDLLSRRQRNGRQGLDVVDDVDVFERYYAAHPEGGFEVFDE
ncbi:MAG: integrase, partial [Actinomycetota bacterium]|nr:integrase [Actinomycetota bacterium]